MKPASGPTSIRSSARVSDLKSKRQSKAAALAQSSVDLTPSSVKRGATESPVRRFPNRRQHPSPLHSKRQSKPSRIISSDEFTVFADESDIQDLAGLQVFRRTRRSLPIKPEPLPGYSDVLRPTPTSCSPVELNTTIGGCSTLLESFQPDLIDGYPVSSGVKESPGKVAASNSSTTMMNTASDVANDHSPVASRKRLRVRVTRRQELVSRMTQRLMCGLVENLASPTRSVSTLEHGNRTKARAICDRLYSCRDDWLNEPVLHLLDFYHLVNDDVRLLCWLARRRLIPNQMNCNKAGCVARLLLMPDQTHVDGWSWRCDRCHRRRSIRHRSIFAHSALSLKTATQILFLWSIGHPIELIPFDTDTSTQATNEWLHCIRGVCRETNVTLKERLGGVEVDGDSGEPGYCRVVEIDESLFSCWVHDPKSGPTLRKIWLLGGAERGTERIFLARCPQNARDSSSLIPVIREFVEPGTAIITDEWEGYAPLGRLPEGYQHYVTDRTKGILSPDQSAVHLQKITGQWSHWKRNFEQLNGTRVDEFETRLDEFLWRMRYSKTILQSFCYSVTLLFEV